MQNDQVLKAVAWNPWHGCKKASPGCKNCFVFKMDQRYGRDTNIITKGKTTYELKDKDCPPNSIVKLCFSSDFFIEEADEWRSGGHVQTFLYPPICDEVEIDFRSRSKNTGIV